MWRDACDAMGLDVLVFLENPGKRFPIDLDLAVDKTGPLPEGLRFCQPIRVSGEAFVQLGTLYADLRMRSEVERACSRCLSSLSSPVDVSESFEVEIPTEATSVDLLPQVLALVVASLDPRPLCRPGCRGLCPTCGRDLNADSGHTCQEPEETPRRLGDFFRR
jgi:uncharacterized protein